MKKTAILTAVLGLFLVAGCNQNGSNSSTEPDESTGTGESSELPEWIDYASQITLPLDYGGRDFFVDGVGQMETVYPIDGDTAHFDPLITTTSSERIKCRFFGIDTPESTGDIQPWGQAASRYTKNILNEAIENGTVVITGDNYDEYRAPTHDSTGERYLSCIWVNTEKKNAPKEELHLLNLMIVQEGYSWARNTSDIPELTDIFLDAQSQAEIYGLFVHSDEVDPEMPTGEYVATSLLDMADEQRKSIASQLDGGYAYDGSRAMSLVGSEDGVIGKFSDELATTDFVVTVRNSDGTVVSGSSYADLTLGEEYLLAYDDLLQAKTFYLTGEIESGAIAVTASRGEASSFVFESETSGVSVKTADTGLYIGYDVDENHDPYVILDSEKDYVWDYLGAEDGLSLPLKNLYDSRKVSVQGTVIGYSNHILYLQDVYEDDITGEISYASINVFVGMSPIPNKYTAINTYLEVRGIAKDSQFGFQITDTNFPRSTSDDDDASSVILTAAENTDVHEARLLEFTSQELSGISSDHNLDYLGTYVTVTDPVTVTGGYIDGKEGTLYLGELRWSIYLSFTYVGDPNYPNWVWNDINDFIGQQFVVTGVFTIHKSTTGRISFQINPSNASGLVWQGESTGE